MKCILSERQYNFLIEQDKEKMDSLRSQVYQPRTPAVADKTRVVKPQVGDPKVKEKMRFCVSGYKEVLPKAVDWWKKWLENPITKEKFKKNWSMDTYSLRDLFKEYVSNLDDIEIVYRYEPYNRAIAYVYPNGKNKVYVNCNFYISVEEKLTTLIHEIQHLLFYIKPFHPKQKISKDFNFEISDPQSFWKNLFSVLGLNSENLSSNSSDDKVDIKISESKKNFLKDGVKSGIASHMLRKYLQVIEDGKERYIEEPQEILSRLYEVRGVLNLKPGENILIPQLVKLINEQRQEVFWLTMSIIHSGKTIKEVLDTFNSYAKNNPNPKTISTTYQV